MRVGEPESVPADPYERFLPEEQLQWGKDRNNGVKLTGERAPWLRGGARCGWLRPGAG